MAESARPGKLILCKFGVSMGPRPAPMKPGLSTMAARFGRDVAEGMQAVVRGPANAQPRRNGSGGACCETAGLALPRALGGEEAPELLDRLIVGAGHGGELLTEC